jgi:nicotinamide riboside kinase
MEQESKTEEHMIRKIAIIGPESTGKSSLSSELATHYKTLWVPEYAREYLTAHGNKYSYESLLEIAKGQIALEEKYIEQASQLSTSPNESLQTNPAEGVLANQSLQSSPYRPAPLFIDTEMYVMKVWSEFVFGKCHQWIIDQIVERKYDLYLLCNIDLPWAPDVLREYPNPHPRRQLFCMYYDIMINQSTPWAVISGNYEQRLQAAITATNSIL